jgi:hypothetical protein
MRKNSAQIYKEILIEKSLENLGDDKEILISCLDHLNKLDVKDLESFEILTSLIEKHPFIEEYILEEVNKIEKKIIGMLGISKEQFKKSIEETERVKYE